MEQKNRLLEINRVLWRTLFLNLSVCIIKIVLGTVTGILAITADGIHSLGDSLSNIIGLFGVRFARKKPDEKYPYGYDKFETIATLIITGIIFTTLFTITKSGVEKLLHPQSIFVTATTFYLMTVSIGINIFVVWYEGRAGKRLESELLIADSSETKGDILISTFVLLGSFLMSRNIFPWLDGVITLIIAFFILRIIVSIIRSTAKILCDAQVIDPKEIHTCVMSVPGAKFCHAIRSHGRKESCFVDLHLGVEEKMSIDEAHDIISHEVKKKLDETFSGIRAVNIHIEPNNENARERKNRVFGKKDLYQ